MLFDLVKKHISVRADIPRFLKAYGLNTSVCEVGVRFGYNFTQLLTCKPELAVAVDHWAVSDNPAEQDTNMTQNRLDKLYDDFVKRTMRESCVRTYRGRSIQAAKLFPLYSFDYIYLDADHSYDGCLADMYAWWPLVRQGGLLAGHDYIEKKSQAGTDFGVIKAVKEFMKKENIKPCFLHTTNEGYRTWILYKNDGE